MRPESNPFALYMNCVHDEPETNRYGKNEMSGTNKLLGWLQCQVFGHVAGSCLPYRNKSANQRKDDVEVVCPRCGKTIKLVFDQKR
jgi:hypothetical protein